MNLHFGPNIKLLRQRRKRSQEDVASSLDIKRTSLSGYENGSVEPPYKVLVKLSNYYKVSIDKLVKYDLSSISEMQLSELEKGFDIDLEGNKMRVLAITVDSENNDNIELIPEKAKAGYRTGFADPEYLKILPTFNLPFLNKSKKYRTFQINGDSMPPVCHEAFVTGEYVENWTMIKDGQPYII
ncbi:MAG: helix-turn-helix domain-containing protein, partial [Bacteroidota bacterium]